MKTDRDHALPAAALATLVVALATAAPVAVQAQTQTQTQEPSQDTRGASRNALESGTIDVVADKPLPDLGTPRNRVPANVQSATAAQMRQQQTLNLPDFMQRNLPSVSIQETQGNPFQPDVRFRGFSASPLLGAPQGLSVFVDGVRVNEPFGDTVNWDLIPQNAIAGMTLIPGSNPLFGLNTLGGALSVQTKSGFTHPGFRADIYGGSFGRAGASVEGGGHGENVDWFISANGMRESGWRDDSPTRVRQLFGKVGWQDSRTDFDLSYALADNTLVGNGLLPGSMLSTRRASIYTYPDQTRNNMNMVNARFSRWLSDDLLLSSNVYFRQTRVRTLNGDLEDDYADEYGDAIDDALEGRGACAGSADPRGCVAARLAGGTGALNRSTTRMRAFGGTVQATREHRLGGMNNRFSVGTAFDGANSRFEQGTQEGALTADRGVIPTEPYELVTKLTGTNRTFSLFATDTLSLSRMLHLTGSLRYQHTDLKLRDQIGTDLNGDHSYSRVNPALSLAVTPTDALSYYVTYNEGSRTPSPIELGCADPLVPCKLPNAMAADPALKQVVTKTIETGVRGRTGTVGWSATIYQATNFDDIQFISSTTSGAGFFNNVGKTRRRGLELAVNGGDDTFSWMAGYSFVDATFQSDLTLLAADNSSADGNGLINVSKGSRMPTIPRHSLKVGARWRPVAAFEIGANVLAFSNLVARGNENNQHVADGTTYLGSGTVGGYTVVNLDARYHLTKNWSVFARVNNLFDRRYSTTGLLGLNAFSGRGVFQSDAANWRHETFYGPGAPRSGWVGVSYAFGGR